MTKKMTKKIAKLSNNLIKRVVLSCHSINSFNAIQDCIEKIETKKDFKDLKRAIKAHNKFFG